MEGDSEKKASYSKMDDVEDEVNEAVVLEDNDDPLHTHLTLLQKYLPTSSSSWSPLCSDRE